MYGLIFLADIQIMTENQFFCTKTKEELDGGRIFRWGLIRRSIVALILQLAGVRSG